MTSLYIVGLDTCIRILLLRINTAVTVFAAWRSKASIIADLDRPVSQHVEEPDDRCMLSYKFRRRQLQQNIEI